MTTLPLETAESMWATIDPENKGKVDFVSFFRGLNSWMKANGYKEYTACDCARIFSDIDQSDSKDNCVTKDEFLDQLSRKKGHYEGLRDQFEGYNTDGKSGLSREEFKAFAIDVGVCKKVENLDNFVEGVFETVDKDKSNTLNFDEFIEALDMPLRKY